jgi:hypothetical protein
VPPLPKTDQEFFEYLRKPLDENEILLKRWDEELATEKTDQSEKPQTETDTTTQKEDSDVDKTLTKETPSEQQDIQKDAQQPSDLPKRPTTEAIFAVQYTLLLSLSLLCCVLTHLRFMLLEHIKGSLWFERRRTTKDG